MFAHFCTLMALQNNYYVQMLKYVESPHTMRTLHMP